MLTPYQGVSGMILAVGAATVHLNDSVTSGRGMAAARKDALNRHLRTAARAPFTVLPARVRGYSSRVPPPDNLSDPPREAGYIL